MVADFQANHRKPGRPWEIQPLGGAGPPKQQKTKKVVLWLGYGLSQLIEGKGTKSQVAAQSTTVAAMYPAGVQTAQGRASTPSREHRACWGPRAIESPIGAKVVTER